jgi:hypothetical protein
MPRSFLIGLLGLLAVAAAPARPPSAPPAPAALERFDVRWTSASHDASGSMPAGNGEVGINLWIEENGDLLFYVSRTDSWSEICRLLKLGRIRISLSPNPFVAGAPFEQRLRLADGRIEVRGGTGPDAVELDIFVDARQPVVHVIGRAERPHTIRVALESWRREKRVLTGDELQSTWTMQQAPADVEVWESGDTVEAAPAGAVTWWHRNAYSIVPLSLRVQGLSPHADLVRDPLADRTFGGRIVAPGFSNDGPSALRAKAARDFHVRVVTHAEQSTTTGEWKARLASAERASRDGHAARRATSDWWNTFWNRSWIFVDGPDGEAVTRAYVLQRWMTAAAGRGHFPIKFNGSIFTVEPAFTGGPPMNPDWRRWGDCYWWQNTRLPYFPMIARGDLDEIEPLFRMYEAAVPLGRARVRDYFGADGVAFPETMTIFGTWSNRDYGWQRGDHRPNEVLNEYIRHIWQPGLELVTLMLDYYEHTLDARFLETRLRPMAREVLRYFDSRFPRDAAGRLVIQPTQAVETYWYGVVNDLPNVAGLRSVASRLLTLPDTAAPRGERDLWKRMLDAAPPLPTLPGSTRLAPAERFDPRRSNIENVELYAIWPFGLLGIGQPHLDVAIDAFRNRPEKASNGWQYDGQVAAAVGLAEEARALLVGKTRNSHQAHRFPAMWGPNYDWLPDQDHGSNIMLTLQAMLLRPVGQKIYLLPAWPRDWNARFKLHAPAKTIVEGTVRDGKLAELKVTPEARRADVIVTTER